MIPWWAGLIIGIVTLLLGAIAGFFIGNWYFKKKLKENPPINEKMIRAMYMQMGRKPSKRQIQAIMNSMKQKK